MPTPDPDRYVTAQNRLVHLAVADLQGLWARLGRADPVTVRAELEQWWPVLISRYGEVAAVLAVDRFTEITNLDGVMVRPVDEVRANGRMRWALGPAFAGDTAGSLSLLVGLVDELVKQPGRSSLIASAAEAGLAFARVPAGPSTCAFCLTLASQGFVYESRASAGERRKYHSRCDCRVAVQGERTPGYDPGRLYDIYDAAREKAGTGDTKHVLAAIRKSEGIN